MKGLALAGLLLAGAPYVVLAGDYEDGVAAVRRGDFQVAQRLWQPLAEAGHAEAQHELALLYLNGRGTAPDPEIAVVWLGRAADRQHAPSLYLLGTLYRDGTSVPQDLVRAASLIRDAADAGLSSAQYSIGLMYYQGEGVDRDDVEALKWLILAAASEKPEPHAGPSVSAFLRDEVASKVTKASLADASKRAGEWRAREQ